MFIMTDSAGAGRTVLGVKQYAGVIDLQSQFEGKVLALVIHDLAAVAPTAGESAVNALVAEVWKQAEKHFQKANTTWTHLSWFVQNAIAQFIDGLRPQTAGC
ncbi:hypothetical protein ACIHEI_34005 [Kitasatospora sp. NPDC051984]|uniref:hypothetical protein n=1 Tax=Kitasatospora sp. NPDC051984 TaxID=3364059 RepID=UPI0037CA92BB